MSPARAALLALCGLAVTAPAAHADVLAASEGRPSGRSDLDLSLVNMSTGAPVTLPAGVNTPDADELHPSLNLDGSRMAFERRNGSTLRIVVVDLKTGQTADLFSGFEQAASQQITPTISPDGKTVATGEAFSADARPQVTLTDLSSFPNGPFTHSTYQTQYRFADGTTGITSNPMITGNLVAFDETPTGNVTRLVVGQIGTTASLPFGAGSTTHGALGAPGGVFTVLFDQRVGTSGQRDLAFRTFTNTANVGAHATVPLTQVNSAGFDETRPSFTPDGRYIAFAAEQPDGVVRLMVWDSGTQTYVNNASLGTFDVPLDGATTVSVTPVLKTTSIVGSQVRFQLLQASGIGILVQRIVGHHRLFGKRVPTLELVGRVPLGKFTRGAGRVRWNGRVGGRRLQQGRYQVTVRAVNRSGGIRDLGVPRVVAIG